MGNILVHLLLIEKWEDAPLVATDTRRTNPTRSPASTVVYLIPKSECTTVVPRNRTGVNSPPASILSQVRRSRSHQRLSKPPVLPPTSTWLPSAVRNRSTFALEFTHGMWSASTRCFPAPVLIDSRPVCVTPMVRPSSRPPVLTSETCSSQSVPLLIEYHMLRRLSVALSSSSPAARLSSSRENTVSPRSLTVISEDCKRIRKSWAMA